MSRIRVKYRDDRYTVTNTVTLPETVNHRLRQALGREELSCLLPMEWEQRGRKEILTVTAERVIPLQTYLRGTVSRREALGIFRQAAALIELCGREGRRPDHLDLSAERLFLEPQSLRLFAVYWPVVNFSEARRPEESLGDLPPLIHLPAGEDRSFLDRIRAFLGSREPFSVRHFAELLAEMRTENEERAQRAPASAAAREGQSGGGREMNDRITHAFHTDVGTRPVNEDSYGWAEEDGRRCYILCDGLGGHGMGDAASQLAVQVCLSQFGNAEDLSVYPAEALQASQDILLAEQAARGAQQKMKTTGVVLAMDEENAYIAHIGDSRLYIFDKNRVRRRTMDHSIPQMLVLTGEIKESEIRHHPERNMLLRVLGVPWDEPMYECMEPIPLNKCQAFLLCSDGFWELITEDEMCRLLKSSSSPDEWLSRMAAVVRENGKGQEMDNNTAVAVWVRKEKRGFLW